MARIEKLKDSFRRCRGTFDWGQCEKLLKWLGYEPVNLKGKTRGSKKRFYNATVDDLIILDVPHDGVMRPGMVSRIRKQLVDRGLL